MVAWLRLAKVYEATMFHWQKQLVRWRFLLQIRQTVKVCRLLFGRVRTGETVPGPVFCLRGQGQTVQKPGTRGHNLTGRSWFWFQLQQINDVAKQGFVVFFHAVHIPDSREFLYPVNHGKTRTMLRKFWWKSTWQANINAFQLVAWIFSCQPFP
jgi:hypothetical protein